MSEQTTPEGLTVEDIETACEVIEAVREKHYSNDRSGFADTLNEAQYLVELYETMARWTTDYKSPNLGDVYRDKDAPHWSDDDRVRIVQTGLGPAKTTYYDTPHGRRSVAWKNESHPPDAPVVIVRYIEGSNKEYHMPVTRLE